LLGVRVPSFSQSRALDQNQTLLLTIGLSVSLIAWGFFAFRNTESGC